MPPEIDFGSRGASKRVRAGEKLVAVLNRGPRPRTIARRGILRGGGIMAASSGVPGNDCGESLRNAGVGREERSISVTEVAATLGVDRTTLRRSRRGSGESPCPRRPRWERPEPAAGCSCGPLAAGMGQGVLLQVEVLVLGRDAGVADQLSCAAAPGIVNLSRRSGPRPGPLSSATCSVRRHRVRR